MSHLRLERPRVAIVTGAARGLGAAIARKLAVSGHPVVLADMLDNVEEAANNLVRSGYQARAVKLDVGLAASVESLPDQIGDWWNDVSILINNAGISPKWDGRKREVVDTPLEEWERVLSVNLTGPFLLSKLCIPTMRARGWGRIVMITSIAAHLPSKVAGAYYGTSKAGLMSLARNLALELGPHGITVNSVSPGRIESEMVAASGGMTNESYLDRIPLGRLGVPDDVADAVSFFASDAAAYLTGAALDVGGGIYMP